jgi:hypothetical protein
MGGVVWLIVSLIWKEPALITTNLVLTITGLGNFVFELLFFV